MSLVWTTEGDSTGEGRRRKGEEERRTRKGKMEGKEAKGRWRGGWKGQKMEEI